MTKASISEGPRSTTNRVRGDYDKVMGGVDRFRAAGLPLSVSAVVMRSLLDALPFTYQIADVIGAGKLKLIHPIRKGNGLHMDDREFLSLDESAELFERLRTLRETHEWTPALRMTTWTPNTEGYSIPALPRGHDTHAGIRAREPQSARPQVALVVTL